jgi:hypothetical protein
MKNTKSKFLSLNNSYDLYLSMTWMTDNDHGICGHIYEIIDYYLLLHTKFNVGILICEDLNWNIIENCILTKYNIEESIILKMKHNTIFNYKPKYVVGKNTNILFVDGGLYRAFYKNGNILEFKNIFSFRCSPLDTHYNLSYKNLILLQDNRVYSDDDRKISIDYKKKINFKYYKNISSNVTKTAMLYLTTNCRRLCNISILDIIFTYKFDRYIIVTNTPEIYTNIIKDFSNIEILTAPVENIFEKFDAYIYTPTGKDGSAVSISFDCSPRFIAECEYYCKEVIYHGIDDKYLESDTGLKWRSYDIKNDFQSLYLDDSDELIDILYDRLS